MKEGGKIVCFFRPVASVVKPSIIFFSGIRILMHSLIEHAQVGSD